MLNVFEAFSWGADENDWLSWVATSYRKNCKLKALSAVFLDS